MNELMDFEYCVFVVSGSGCDSENWSLRGSQNNGEEGTTRRGVWVYESGETLVSEVVMNMERND
jgi:hypothetical protein